MSPGKSALNHYGFALPDSPLLESVNRALRVNIEKPGWNDPVYRYTGDELNRGCR